MITCLLAVCCLGLSQDLEQPPIEELAAIDFLQNTVRPATYNLEERGVDEALVTLRVKESPLGEAYRLVLHWDAKSNQSRWWLFGVPPNLAERRAEMAAGLAGMAKLALLSKQGNEAKRYRLARTADGDLIKVSMTPRGRGAGGADATTGGPEQIRWYRPDGRLMKVTQRAPGPQGMSEYRLDYEFRTVEGQFLLSRMTRTLVRSPRPAEAGSVETFFHYRHDATRNLERLERLVVKVTRGSEQVQTTYLIRLDVADEIDRDLARQIDELSRPGQPPRRPPPDGRGGRHPGP